MANDNGYETNIRQTIAHHRRQADAKLIKLSEAVPLATPLHIAVEPTSNCNFRCTFCPYSYSELLAKATPKRLLKKGMMKMDLFKKIISDIANFPDRLRLLDLVKRGEPLLHPLIVGMVYHSKKADIAETVATTTNGSPLSRDLARALIDAGLDLIRFSIEHVNDQGYKKITKTWSDYEAIRGAVEFLFNERERRNAALHINAKIIDPGLTDDDKKKFINDFGDISDSLNIMGVQALGQTGIVNYIEGHNPGRELDAYTTVRSDRKVCPEPFKTMAINFDGPVMLCCPDWSQGTEIGDVSKESLVDIWNGRKMYRFRMLNLTGKRYQIPSCAHCQYVETFQEVSDLDDVAEELATKLKARQK